MRTIQRPSRISSVPSRRKPRDFSDRNNEIQKDLKNFEDENTTDNAIPQKRKLRPPNFKSTTENEKIKINLQTMNDTNEEVNSNFENSSKIQPYRSKEFIYNSTLNTEYETKTYLNSKKLSSSITKDQYLVGKRKQKSINDSDINTFNAVKSRKPRASSVTREIRHKSNDSDLNSNYLYTYRPVTRRKNSINFDEFKNPDGSPKKLSQKFRQLQNPVKNDDVIREKTTEKENFGDTKLNNEDLTTPRKQEPCIRRKKHFMQTPTRDTTEIIDNFDKPTQNISETSDNRPSTIEIALNRIQKELKSKESNPQKVPEKKPAIKRKTHKARLEIQQQNATTIDFPNYQTIQNEKQNQNKSVIEEVKPHVTFIGNFKPPTKKEPEYTIIPNNVTKPQKQFVEPTKSDFGKKFEFPPEFMKKRYSNIMISPESDS